MTYRPVWVGGVSGLLAVGMLLAVASSPSSLQPKTALAGPVDDQVAITTMRLPAEPPLVEPALRRAAAAALPNAGRDWFAALAGFEERLAGLLTPPPMAAVTPAWAPAPRWNGAPAPRVSASAVAVLDEASLAVMLGRNAEERRAPASLTKIATATLAIQSQRMDETVESDINYWSMPGSSLMGLMKGDTFTLRDLVYGLMLESGNDAALAIGRHLAGHDALFVYRMNALAAHLGLQNTHFIDPHGLGGRDHYSSAHDLAILARYCMQSGEFATIASAREWVADGSRRIAMESYVEPFLESYEGGEGMKTGFTRAAGATFIGSAVRNGHRVYVVLLNSQDRFGEASLLLDWAFENHEWPGVMPTSPTPGDGGQVQSAQAFRTVTSPGND